jgi:Ca2+-binding RTX toxin-like protein
VYRSNSLFGPAINVGGSGSPASVVVADVNNDGIPDLILADDGQTISPNLIDSVRVELGNGDGTFGSPMDFDKYTYPDALAVGDFNNDGHPDLLVGSRYNSAVVLFGAGDGTFNQKSAPVGGEAVAVAAADVNGDGRADAVLDYAGNTIGVRLSNGDGTLQPVETYDVGTQIQPGSIAIADVNGDGRPDLLVASRNGADLLLGNGDGTFKPMTAITTAAALALAVGDLNGDGQPDLVVTANAGRYSSSVETLLGNGDGTFRVAQSVAIPDLGLAAAVVDVNGDSRADVVLGVGGSVEVCIGSGDGTLGNPLAFVVGDGAESLAVSDVTGDGRPDVLAGLYLGGNVSLLVNTNGGTPSFAGLSGGTLNLTGSNGNDTIDLTSEGGFITANLNGETTQPFASSLINRIVVNGGEGDDSISVDAGVPATSVLGGSGADTLLGGTNNDTLLGAGGNDSVWGGGGNDLILGGGGNDTGRGGPGDDVLRGGKGDDLLVGGVGNDQLTGGPGADTLRGGAGNDTLFAIDGLPDDVLYGGLDTDVAHFDVGDSIPNTDIEQVLNS